LTIFINFDELSILVIFGGGGGGGGGPPQKGGVLRFTVGDREKPLFASPEPLRTLDFGQIDHFGTLIDLNFRGGEGGVPPPKKGGVQFYQFLTIFDDFESFLTFFSLFFVIFDVFFTFFRVF
jgi:hypothetical protein